MRQLRRSARGRVRLTRTFSGGFSCGPSDPRRTWRLPSCSRFPARLRRRASCEARSSTRRANRSRAPSSPSRHRGQSQGGDQDEPQRRVPAGRTAVGALQRHRHQGQPEGSVQPANVSQGTAGRADDPAHAVERPDARTGQGGSGDAGTGGRRGRGDARRTRRRGDQAVQRDRREGADVQRLLLQPRRGLRQEAAVRPRRRPRSRRRSSSSRIRATRTPGSPTSTTRQKKFDLAQQASAKAAKLSAVAGGGGSAEASYNQGVILWNAGKFAEAKVQFEAAVKADPNMAMAHYQLGMANLNLGQIPEASAAFQEYLKVDPNGPKAAEVRDSSSSCRSSAGPSGPATVT